MTEPTPADQPVPAPGTPPATEAATPPPQLLTATGPIPGLRTVTWQGPPGAPAWAIPVTVPPGTHGYAIFLPLVPQPTAPYPAAPTTVPAGAAPATVAPGEASSAVRPAAPSATVGQAAVTVPPGPESSTVSPGRSSATGAAPDADQQVGASGQPTSAVPGQVAAVGRAQAPAPADAPDGEGDPAGSTGTVAGPNPASALGEPVATADTAGTTTPPAGAPGAATSAAAGARPVPQQTGAAPGSPAGPVSAPQVWHPGPGWDPRWGRPPAGVPGQFPVLGPISPPGPSWLKAHWPGPDRGSGGWAVPGAVLAGALGVAVFLPLGRVGIGWLLSAVAVLVSVLVAVRRASADLPVGERRIRLVWAVSALALLSILAFRNAWWLVTFSVLGALGCTALAVIGGRQLRSIGFSLVATPFAALRGIPWVSGKLKDRSRLRPGTAGRITVALLATVAVLIVFGALLSSADAAFSVLLGDLAPQVSAGTVFTWIFLLAVGGLLTTAAVYTLSAPPDLSTVDGPPRGRIGSLEWGLPVGALLVLFAGFVAVQFSVLFGGQRHVLTTAGLDYAEYARSGFWQLFTVTLLTLAVLGTVGRWAARETRRQRLLLRGLLGPLCILSIVIVSSAIDRMYTYQQVYSFTGERVFVMAFELLLGLLFALVMLAGIRLRGAWLPRTAVGLTVLMLVSLAVLNPEAYVARRNIARYHQDGKIDAWYLRALSSDATPALAGLPDPVRRCVLSWIDDDLAGPDPWYAWNLGRQRARDVLDDLGPQALGGPADCQRADQFDLPKTR